MITLSLVNISAVSVSVARPIVSDFDLVNASPVSVSADCPIVLPITDETSNAVSVSDAIDTGRALFLPNENALSDVVATPIRTVIDPSLENGKAMSVSFDIPIDCCLLIDNVNAVAVSIACPTSRHLIRVSSNAVSDSLD